ncbi:chromatin assembly factor 1 subunit A-B [Bombus bifarius]|uniref:Chromatin assembly factor 1 subunit A-B n=1 Tax=Bombus bifarius TaxID=103933 RepID=A0A6P8LSV0_9HYME|nr:chromatin assembly factor 1 subunit A-B [Bombus bifarius]XP_033298414.1 chromatin assembly factor 1 subunit A-B [Bombus bifarius]
MKTMDSNEQDDCSLEVTSVKRKKMKQAQLPFQMRSPVQSPNVVHSRKRKLASPFMECKSPKAMKILKNNLSKDSVNSEPNSTSVDTENKDIDIIKIVEDPPTETENAKENAFSKEKASSKTRTSKQIVTGQKKLEKQEKLKSSPLTKFLQKTDKQKDASKEESEISFQEKNNDSIEEVEESSNKATKTNINTPGTTNNLSNKVEGLLSVANNSLCQSDSDLAVLSSDTEEKDEETKSSANTMTDTPSTSQTIKTPKIDKTKLKKLTPKQEEKRLLNARRKEEKKRLKMEKEKKLEEERQNRKKEKEEKRKQKEERGRVEREQKLMEKKRKEQRKQMEIEQRQKGRQAKEEERRRREEAKEEEKKRKEEERLEAERKKQKAATTFTSFFVAKKQEKSVEDESTNEVKNFMPFEVKGDMKIAKVCRRFLTEQEKLLLDKMCNEGSTQMADLYLSEIKGKRTIPRKSSKTWPLETKDDVILLDEENDGSSNIVNQNVIVEMRRPKLLQFSENQRPPYWGTWRKRSKIINPRKPFSKDTQWFNYEIDSDEEWEEEEPGESLRGSDDEKDEENPEDNEYDVDNDFMVPHGYLSDEELRADEEDKQDMTPETQKFKLKLLGEQFESERNAKTAKLKPKIIGCIWKGSKNEFQPNVPPRIVDFLSARDAWVYGIPILLPTMNEAMATNECSTPTQQQPLTSSKKTRFPEAAIPDLIRLIHGNTYSRRCLVKEFIAYWSKKNKGAKSQPSKASIQQKIREIGKWMPCPEKGPMHSKACWYVDENIRKEHINEELPLPNCWSYILTPKKKRDITKIRLFFSPK